VRRAAHPRILDLAGLRQRGGRRFAHRPPNPGGKVRTRLSGLAELEHEFRGVVLGQQPVEEPVGEAERALRSRHAEFDQSAVSRYRSDIIKYFPPNRMHAEDVVAPGSIGLLLPEDLNHRLLVQHFGQQRRSVLRGRAV